jgi:TPR repeat protein
MSDRKMTIPEALKVLDLQPGCSEQEAHAAFHVYAEKWQPQRFAGDARRQAVARRKLQLGNSALHFLAAARFETRHVAGDYTLEGTGDGREYFPDIPDTSGEESYFGEQEGNHSVASNNRECNTASNGAIGLPHYVAAAMCGLFLLVAGVVWLKSDDLPPVVAAAAKVTQQPITSSVAQPRPSSELARPLGQQSGHQLAGSSPAAKESSPATASVTEEVSEPATPAAEETTQGTATADKPLQSEEPTFFLGSTPAQVARAQGTPNKVDGDTWYFGSPPRQSTVTFRGERVVEWNSDPNAKLRISVLPRGARAEWPSRFTIGSHKTAVAAIQGAPDRVAGDVWFFGQQPSASRVTFKDDRVVTWESNPAKRLNVEVPTPSNATLPGHAAYSQAVKAMFAIGGLADPELANELFRQSANQGHPGACVELGFKYIDGGGSIAGGQWAKADRWFREAATTASLYARQNNPAAMFAYAFLLFRGVEEEHNHFAACEWLHQAGRMGHVPSLIRLGRMLEDPEASPQTKAFRVQLFRLALELDSSVAGVELANVLMNTQTLQQGSSEVTALLEKATLRNLAAAHHAMAHALQTGWMAIGDAEGRPKDQARSSEVAYQHLLQAYRSNRFDSVNHAKCIAICLFNGNGVLKNAHEGMKYMKIACDSNPWIMLEFADMIHNGDHLKKDEKTAVTWYRRAFDQFVEHARRGDLSAALKAAEGYEEGLVAKQDLQEARRLYRAAASSVCPSIKRAAIEKVLEYGDPVEGAALIPPF